jgi:mono/diheme cytochrome c family protein
MRRSRVRRTAAWLAAAAAVAAGCSERRDAPQLSEAAQRGRAVYTGVCIACHGADPSLDGALGPAISGSSRELVEARVVRGTYPPGYTPKRPSSAMPAFPHLADDVDALTAWLDECCPARP